MATEIRDERRRQISTRANSALAAAGYESVDYAVASAIIESALDAWQHDDAIDLAGMERDHLADLQAARDARREVERLRAALERIFEITGNPGAVAPITDAWRVARAALTNPAGSVTEGDE